MPLTTIADSRRHGLKALFVQCRGPDCYRNAVRFTFDELKLSEEMPFVQIPRRRRFVCTKCGSRVVDVSADWRDHNAAGTGRR